MKNVQEMAIVIFIVLLAAVVGTIIVILPLSKRYITLTPKGTDM